MKLFKILAGVFLASTMTAGVALAQDDGSTWLGAPLKKPLNQVSIGFSFQGGVGGNIYVVQYVDKLKELVAKYGINLTILDAENDPAKQSQQMPDLISQQPDVIIVWAANGKAIVPAIKQAHDAGIPVVTINAQIDASGLDYIVAHAGPNDYNEGTQAAQTLIDAMGGKGNVVEVRGTIGFGPGDQRAQAFVDVAKKYPDIKLLDVQAGNWSQGQGQSIMENFITRFGKQIDGVLSSDGYSGTGAYLAVQAAVEAGQLDADHVKFVDPNIVATNYDLIGQGKYTAAVLQTPQDDAEFSLKVALKVAEGVDVPKQNYLPTPMLTKDNYSQYPRPGF
ncbi:MAG TPA: sugar ABC transporter substrate-binding protein [Reyranella sp.]